MNKSFIEKKLGILVLFAAGSFSLDSNAQSLTSDINNLFGNGGLRLDTSGSSPFAHTAHFSSSSSEALGVLTATLAPSSSDFPSVSTAPGFGFKYNSELNTFEPTRTNNGGSLFVEGGKTLGAGKMAAGVNYAYVDYQTLNGKNLNGYSFTLNHNDFPIPGNPHPSFEDATIDVNIQKFNLTSNIISAYFTYGVTDKLDVNVLLPVMVTDINMQATATIHDVAFRGADLHYFNNATLQTTKSFYTNDHKVGVGDLQLRSKYQFLASSDGLNMSGLLKFRFPTGDAANFQGLGDYMVQPYIAISKTYGDFDFHTNGGIDVDLTHSDRSRARYGIGASYQFSQIAGFMLDVIGNSNITSQNLTVSVPQYSTPTGPATSYSTLTSQLSTNVVDLSMGFKATPSKYFTAYFNFLVPITNDGLRTGFTPVAGVEMPL